MPWVDADAAKLCHAPLPVLDMIANEPEVADRPAAVRRAFISASTDAAAAEN